MASAVTRLSLTRGVWIAAWVTAGASLLWNPAGVARQLAPTAELPTLSMQADLPAKRTRLSWWPQGAETKEVSGSSSQNVREKKEPRVVSKPRPKAVVPVELDDQLRVSVEMPDVDSLAAGAAGESLDPRAQALAQLVADGFWKGDPRLTAVALYVVCPEGPGLCRVEEVRVLQSPQPDVQQLLRSYAPGVAINLAREDREQLVATGGGWLIRTFRVANSEELLP